MIGALTEGKAPGTVDALIVLIYDKEPFVQHEAIGRIGYLRDPKVLPALLVC